jgi:hypothetical protein
MNSTTNASWFILINTMRGSSEAVGTAISSHRSLVAAYRAADKVQPNKRNSGGAYVPTTIRLSETRMERGQYVPQTAQRPDADEADRVWADYATGEARR